MRLLLREALKSALPKVLRQRISSLLDRPPIDTVVLRDLSFRADDRRQPRITLVLPDLSRAEAFGGVTTGIAFFLALAAALGRAGGGQERPWDIRILTESVYDPADSVLPDLVRAAGLAADRVQVDSLRRLNWAVPTRRDDIFLVYNWWIALNIDPVLAAQARTYDVPRRPKLYIFQEYEPAFYPLSSAHLLAREAIEDRAGPLWMVFNTRELADYYARQGHRATRSHVFEPQLDARLRALRENLSVAEKTRTLLVYGRPRIPRNCFPIIEKGLQIWSARTTAAPDWQIVSAGVAHRDLPLAGGRRLTSLGKLSLAEYGRLLRKSAIGISLMASPHPSYPPLEMAHFGVRAITNRYDGKEPSQRHDNLITLPDVRPATLAAELDRAIAEFESDPGLGLRGESRMPDYLGDAPFDGAAGIAADLVAQLAAG